VALSAELVSQCGNVSHTFSEVSMSAVAEKSAVMTVTAGVPCVCVYVQEQHVHLRELQAEHDKMEDRVRAEAAQKADLKVRYACCSWTAVCDRNRKAQEQLHDLHGVQGCL
jgi:hypothetical protein